jgi:magnesium transporter
LRPSRMIQNAQCQRKRAWLYDAHGQDREVEIDGFDLNSLEDSQLLWVDVVTGAGGSAATIARAFNVDPGLFDRVLNSKAAAGVEKYHRFATLLVISPPRPDAEPQRVGFVIGADWLITFHDCADVNFIDRFRAQDREDTRTGELTAGLLSAALLDWHLESFFACAAEIEHDADVLDDAILARSVPDDLLRQLVKIRRRISALRLALVEQRQTFYGLSRPDVTVEATEADTAAFAQLGLRFERAIDEVERTRDVLLGSFDLFTSLASHETNALVRVLTFVTVVVGISSAVAGLLGMNFKLPLFESGTAGFMTVVGTLLCLSGAALLIARHRKWL